METGNNGERAVGERATSLSNWRATTPLPYTECQQDIPAHAAAQLRVPRWDEQHPSSNHRPCGVDISALGLHTVHRFELACGIELPQRLTIGRRVRVDDPGARSEEDDAGNHGDRRTTPVRR